MYLNGAELTPSTYELTATVNIVGVGAYSVTWTVEVADADKEIVKIGEPGQVLVDGSVDHDVDYKIVAVIADDDGHSTTVSYDRQVPKFEENTYAEYAAAAEGDYLVVKGIVVAIVSKDLGDTDNSLYLVDNDGGYYIYGLTALPEGIKVGDTVRASGSKKLYNGTYEIVEASVEILDTTTSVPAPIDYTDLYKAAAVEGGLSSTSLVSAQAQLVTIKGVTVGGDGGNGYRHFTLDGLQSYVRISSSNCPLNKEDTAAFEAAFPGLFGMTADVTGLVTLYNGNFYLTPVSVDAFSNAKLPELSDAEKVAFEKDALVFETEIIKDGSIELPSAGAAYNTVAIAWDFKEGTTHDCATIADGKLNVTLPSDATTITLVATLTCGSETATKEFVVEIASAKIDWKVTADALEICETLENGATTEDFYYFYGTVGEIYNTEYCNFYLLDEQGNSIVVYGLYAPNGTDRYGSKRQIAEIPFKEGDLICMRAQVQKYYKSSDGSITPELVNAVHVETPEKGTEIFVAYNATEAIAIANALENGATTEEYAYFVGAVGEIYNTQYCNFYLTDANGGSIVVYGLYAPNGTDRYGSNREIAEIPFKEGDTVVLRSKVQKYYKSSDGSITPELVSAILVSITSDGTVVPPVEGPLSEGQAYYLTVNQETVGKTLHFTGKSANQAWYLATTQNTAEAVEVFVEVVDGNYRIYFMNGTAKTYIRMYERSAGSGSIELTTTVPSETYSYDETYKTLVLVSGSNKYYMGMYGTFETISCSKYSYITSAGNFASTFTPVEGGSDTPAHECESVCPECGKCLDPDCTETACLEKCEGHQTVVPTVEGPLSEGQAYYLTVNQETVGKTLHFTGKSANQAWYLATTQNTAEAVEVFVEVVDGNYRIYFMNGTAKTYIRMYERSAGSGSIELTTTVPSETYSYDKTYKTLVLTVGSNKYYMGMYGTFETISCSKYSYITSAGNFASVFTPVEGGTVVPPVEEPAVVINGVNYTEAQAEEALLAIKAGDVVVINTNGTIAKEYTFVAADYTLSEGAVLTIQANAVAPAGAKLTVGSKSVIVVESGATIDISALTQEDFATSTEARLEIAAGATVIMPAYTEALWNDAYLKVVIEAMVADSDVGAKLVLGETKLTKTASGWEAEAPAALEDVVINVSDLAASTEVAPESELVAGSGVYLTKAAEGKKFVIDANNKSIDGFDFTLRFKFYGTMKNESAGITGGLRLELKGAAKITVYAISGNKDATDRNLVLKDSAFADIKSVNVLGDKAYKVEFEVSAAGTYYLGSSNSGMNIYYLAINYVAPAHVCESVCEECGKCLDEDCAEAVCAEKCEGHVKTYVWTLVTDASTLAAGDKVAIVYSAGNFGMSDQNGGGYRNKVNITKSADKSTLTAFDGMVELTLGKQGDNWTFADGTQYLGLTSDGNKLFSVTDATKNTAQWTISIDAKGNAVITSVAYSARTICYNSRSPRFACYKASSNQGAVVLYKLVEA